jgi:hypothetical protein
MSLEDRSRSGEQAAGPHVKHLQETASFSNSSTATLLADGLHAAARRRARLLVADIRLFHEPAVNEGRRHRNLLSRLAPEIEKARRAYDEQVPQGVRSETDYFHQELIRTLAGGDATLLGNLA